jgi:hypothetical protein
MKPEFSTPENIAEVTKLPIEAVHAAFQKAEELGFETVGNIQENLDNGYNDVKIASGQDFFPNGATGPIVKKVGPSGARQGDNPEQKKMQVDEAHRELVYAYRKFLKESAPSKTVKKNLTENQQAFSNFKVQEHDLEANASSDEIFIRGRISASATVIALDGQSKEIRWDVWVEASGGFEWEDDESPTGWNYKTDDPTYTSNTYAATEDPEFTSIAFDDGSTFFINNEEFSVEEAQQQISPKIMKHLLDPTLYSGIVGEKFDSKAETLEEPGNNYESDDYGY